MINTTETVDISTLFPLQVCNSLKHRGEILEKVIKEGPNKVSIAELARRTGYDRTTVYQHLKNPNLDLAIVMKYGKALKHDFSKELPELLEYGAMVVEPLTNYRPLTLSEALQERDYWKDKYIRLLEKYNEMVVSQLNKKDNGN